MDNNALAVLVALFVFGALTITVIATQDAGYTREWPSGLIYNGVDSSSFSRENG